MSDLLQHARDEYARLIRLDIGGLERHYNQSYMAFLRDFIAEQEGRDSEDVQNEYGNAALCIKSTKRPRPRTAPRALVAVAALLGFTGTVCGAAEGVQTRPPIVSHKLADGFQMVGWRFPRAIIARGKKEPQALTIPEDIPPRDLKDEINAGASVSERVEGFRCEIRVAKDHVGSTIPARGDERADAGFVSGAKWLEVGIERKGSYRGVSFDRYIEGRGLPLVFEVDRNQAPERIHQNFTAEARDIGANLGLANLSGHVRPPARGVQRLLNASGKKGKDGHKPLSGGILQSDEPFGPIPPFWFLAGFFGFFAGVLLTGGYLSYLLVRWVAELGDRPSQK